MKLRELLASIMITGTSNLVFTDDFEIKNITNDSRKVDSSSMFVAIKGKHADGHSYLNNVYEKGCSIAIVEEIMDSPIMQVRVPNSRAAMSRLSSCFYGKPSEKMKVVAITATNGKTTISFMLDEIFKSCGLKTGLIGTVKIKADDEIVKASMTTPEAFVLQGYFKKMEEKKVDVVTMEISSLALEQMRAQDVMFDIVSFNNFNREHIDEHGSFEAYWEAKSSIITKSRKNSVAVLNLDDPAIKSLKGKGNAKQIFYSLSDKDAYIYAENINLEEDNPKFTVNVRDDINLNGFTISKQKFNVELSIPGFHTVKNAMACISMALAYGLSGEEISRGIKNFRGLERRFEMIYNEDFKIIDDHFANEENINVTLDSLSKLKYKNLHIVYAIRGNRGKTVNRENLETLAKWQDKLRLKSITGTETLGKLAKKDVVSKEEKEVYDEYIKNIHTDQKYFEEIDEAIKYAIEMAQKDDIILLAGSQGMDMGGRIALEYLAGKTNDNETKERILSPVKERICG